MCGCFNKNFRTRQMAAEEGGELYLEPFVHIQREDENVHIQREDENVHIRREDEYGEGAESHNITTTVDGRRQLLDEGTSSVEAHPEPKMLELSEEGGKVIKASKTIDEALNEIDDSYGKHRQSKENNQPESTTETFIRENRSELKKAAKNHSDARNPGSEKQSTTSQIPWAEHSHGAVNRTVSLIKEKNKKSKIPQGVEDPALERVKREGVPLFLDSKGFQKMSQ